MSTDTTASADATAPPADAPPFRYGAALAGRIERAWQDRWEAEGTFHVPNPTGAWTDPTHPNSGGEKVYLMDMFPYPSGSGLHVGHPLGFIGTDVLGRYLRMTGRNVLHTMGFDAFGLPAEQYAVQTGTHPRKTTEENVERYRRSCGSWAWRTTSAARWPPPTSSSTAGPSGSSCRSSTAGTTASAPARSRSWRRRSPTGPARRPTAPVGRAEHRRAARGDRRPPPGLRLRGPGELVPRLGTVLANEEVTADGRSERGNFPVFRRNLKQWMLRITAYADRLVADLDRLDWPESVKAMQRNWIGPLAGRPGALPGRGFRGRRQRHRHRGVHHPPRHPVRGHLHGAGPEHPLVDAIAPAAWPEGTGERWSAGATDPRTAVADYRPRPPASPTWTARRTRTRPASSPAPSPPTRSTASRSRCSSPTTC
jgi:leucyl-tRNA synthetase